ncbi:hypothetical protein ASPWEDRAFT_111381 [Aspergillus wentii DTO 134E9]|uniref:Enoyl reductase (ER) domain-containing protein n=1 Tax=Aspergillus wentii DTO 134E9 TaxID=1073089 RepID=A0A1L9RM30_ASPWE|nr:uncharacterized protein ASPWEDRAFT_111381 [Aspergillus wentii DTO 134E9]OJJ35954.1 hypothetical protein ASPWEDRAFT_111381 [Aspergillus wentii DTO 134E9]
MNGLVYTAANTVEIQDRPIPQIECPTDAVVKMMHSSICGTDLHILKGHVPTVDHGRILGHEGVGTIVSLGSNVDGFFIGDIVLISCITACGVCPACTKGLRSHCGSGGWILGNVIDGTQAEYVRIPQAAASLYKIPGNIDSAACVALSDAFPTGLECGAMNSQAQPGNSVAIVGAGPVGLSAMLTAKLYSPATLVVIDVDESRLDHARKLGADIVINPQASDAMETLDSINEGQGFDSVIEAVGSSESFEMCQKLVAPGGSIANIGVHGQKVDLYLNELWDHNISIKTRLVDTTTIPTLLRLCRTGRLNPSAIFTHHYPFSEISTAYEKFGNAKQEKTLKVSIKF